MKFIDKLIDVCVKNYYDEVDLYFSKGFKLGLQIAIECIKE